MKNKEERRKFFAKKHLPPESERGKCPGKDCDPSYEPTRKDAWLIGLDSSYCPCCGTIGNVICESSSLQSVPETTDGEHKYRLVAEDSHCTCCGYEFHIRYWVQLYDVKVGFINK